VLQVHKAFEYLSRAADVDKVAVRYQVSVRRGDSAARARGIYLRDAASCSAAVTHTVNVAPQLHKDADTRTERLLVGAHLLLKKTWMVVSAVSGIRTISRALGCGNILFRI
jgi:hypothetical protein